MPLQKLEALLARRGHFHCRIHNGADTGGKTVPFRHTVAPPVPVDVPDIGGLRPFYAAFGAVAFYHCAEDEAARYLAPPAEWPRYQEEFGLWIADIGSDEWEELAPADLLCRNEDGCCDFQALVIGETPHSGNYILMADNGTVYEFDHDGYEFIRIAPDILAYAETLLQPDACALRDYTAFITFPGDADNPGMWYVASVQFADGASFSLRDDE